MSEPTLTPQDQADLDSLGITLEGSEPEQPRCLLEVWRHLLSSAKTIGTEPIPVGVALKVVSTWPWLTFQETARYHELYHVVVSELGEALDLLLAEHPDALGWTGEQDAEHNHELYREILVTWHLKLDTLEAAWRAEDDESHIWVAVIPAVRSLIFARDGLAGHLDSIGFSLTNDEFIVALQEAKGE
jgi:hypothetical protein